MVAPHLPPSPLPLPHGRGRGRMVAPHLLPSPRPLSHGERTGVLVYPLRPLPAPTEGSDGDWSHGKLVCPQARLRFPQGQRKAEVKRVSIGKRMFRYALKGATISPAPGETLNEGSGVIHPTPGQSIGPCAQPGAPRIDKITSLRSSSSDQLIHLRNQVRHAEFNKHCPRPLQVG